MKNTESLTEAKLLEKQRDNLRSELKTLQQQNIFDKNKQELLETLDRLFLLHCKNNNLQLSKFGRLK
jgi:hypothetical protein